jgi:hypothetical protein
MNWGQLVRQAAVTIGIAFVVVIGVYLTVRLFL